MSQSAEVQVNRESFILDAGTLENGEPLYIRGEVRIAHGREGERSEEDAESAGVRLPVLIISHGFKGFKDWGFFPYVAERFASRGFYTVTFNFSCNGVNERDFDELDKFAVNTYSREQQDLKLLLGAVKAGSLPFGEYADAGRIHLLGHSRGGGNSILAAAEHPEIRSVTTWNGNANPDLFDDAFKERIAQDGVAYVANARTKQEMPIRAVFYEDLRLHGERYDIARRLQEIEAPVLQVQGDQDSPRLKAGFETLRQASPRHAKAIVTIEGGNHTFGAVHPFQGTTPYLEQALEATLSFLENNQKVTY
ncbi:alpha/beta hydrolase family protein [Paenibacillus puerhi]|uniref:alpha/beta hydrolase family protein n=1 Tax=Paenibacillus puerhi TaxID=2692622 RepID=UPI0013593474|nr:alpha/beta hydrolase [Paenibacillus puerhi]